jgi:hypothetical protein
MEIQCAIFRSLVWHMRDIGQYHRLGGHTALWLVDYDGPPPEQQLAIDGKKNFIEMPAGAGPSRPGYQRIAQVMQRFSNH